MQVQDSANRGMARQTQGFHGLTVMGGHMDGLMSMFRIWCCQDYICALDPKPKTQP